MTLVILAAAGSALVLTQSSLTAPVRDFLDQAAREDDAKPRRSFFGRVARFENDVALKLMSCPMCAGFWLGLAWAAALGLRGVELVGLGFVGSLASALLVALWLALSEAALAIGLWRYLRTPAPAEPKRNVLMTIKTAGKWPTAGEVKLRDDIERDLAANGIKRVDHDCGDGTITIFLPEVSDIASVASTCAWIISRRGIEDVATVSVS